MSRPIAERVSPVPSTISLFSWTSVEKERRMPNQLQLQFSKMFRECGSPRLRRRIRPTHGGFMSYSGFSKLIGGAALAIAFVVLPAIAGSSVASAQDRFYRGRDFGRERGYCDDDLRDHQRREKFRQKRHERNEREALRDHQEEEYYRYGDSDELRHHQQHERQELRGHQRD